MKTPRLLAIVMLAVSLLWPFGAAAMAQTGPVQWGPIVKFEGVITSRPADTVGEWEIGEYKVQVTEDTEIHEQMGNAEVGAQVMVTAQEQLDGTLVAMLLRVQGVAEVVELQTKGVITELADDYVVVNDLTIRITEDTVIKGQLEVGALVKVWMLDTGTEYVVVEIRVEPDDSTQEVEFEGLVTRMTTTMWTIGGHDIAVNGETAMEGDIQLNLRVEVRARVRGSETPVALRIRLEARSQQGPNETPGPWQTPDPSNTPQGPNETPGPWQTPDPSNTPQGPNQTPNPSCTPKQTPDPTCTPQGPKQTPDPTCTPKQTPDPTCSCTPQGPNQTPGPSGTPQGPDQTPGPTRTPGPKEIPGVIKWLAQFLESLRVTG